MSLLDGMERLKKKIHGSKIPLSKNGQRVMGLIYFTVPVVIGYYSLQWVERKELTNRDWQRQQPPLEHKSLTVDDLNQSLQATEPSKPRR